MDLLGYAAIGGLERVAIVAGAVIIGYWGYRLYTTEKQVGLVFMGLAVLVLVGALATGSSYVKSVGEGYQLASASTAPATPAEVAQQPPAEPDPATTPEGSPFQDQQPGHSSVAEITAEPAEAADAESAPEAATAPESRTEAEVAIAPAEFDDGPADAPVRLATGQELGGRIMSVKSENVSLEWSSDSD